MDKASVNSIIARFKVALASRGIKNMKFVLYGSQATAQARQDSDIDLIVISPSFAGMEYLQRLNLLAEAIAEVWEPIEAIAKTPEEWSACDALLLQMAHQGEIVA